MRPIAIAVIASALFTDVRRRRKRIAAGTVY